MSTLTEREIADRLLTLIGDADKLRMPSHRRTAETCMAEQDEVRSGLRRLYRDLTGEDAPRSFAGRSDAASLRQAGAFVPAALIRHQARLRA